MPSLTAAYGIRRIHIPVTPGTPLSEVRDKACAQFELDPSAHTLSHQNHPCDLSLPFRLSNLVANATVTVTAAGNSTSPIRIKVRKPYGSDFVGTFGPTTTIASIREAAGGVSGCELRLNDRRLDDSATLKGLGLTGAVLLTLKDMNGAQKAAAAALPPLSQPHNAKLEDKSIDPAKIDPTDSDNGVRSFNLITPPPQRLASPESSGHTSASSEEPEMTHAQFVTYYNHIKHQAEPPLLTRATKERLKEEKRSQITKTTVRIRLPDEHCLDAVFLGHETGESVYSFVTSHLRRPLTPFELFSVSPSRVLGRYENLITDCRFGGRVLLILRWLGDSPPPSNEPVLSEKALLNKQTSSRIEERPAVLSTAEAELKSPVTQSKKPANGIPKWLKLQK